MLLNTSSEISLTAVPSAERSRRIPFKDGREIFRLEPMFFRQSAAAEEHILNARRRRIPESQFEVEFIILHDE